MRTLAALAALAALALASCATPRAAPSPPSPMASSAVSAAASAPPVAWQHWDAATFARAKGERRIVVVTVATEWCHWCHVMDEKTWSDPAVRALVADRFIAVREDADARPDLAERYADWGWPAIALLSPDAAPIAELRGYQEKGAFLALLRSLVARLDRGEALARAPAATTAAAPSPLDATFALARAQLDASFDAKQGGWGPVQKYPFAAPVEEALLRAALTGDDASRARALFTLSQERALIDPVDGGMFQYSLDGVWTAPHTEKLAALNGDALGSYALGFSASHDPALAGAGRDIARWLLTIMRDDSGAFFANQDADVGTRGDRPLVLGRAYYAMDAAARRKAGAPFVDRHVYAAHNGRVIAGLARFAAATHDDALLQAAVAAAHAIEAGLGVAGGGFAHGHGDAALHLDDQVAMGTAYLALAEATGDAAWRERARAVARVLARFHDATAGGFFEQPPGEGFELAPQKPVRQNADAARFLLKLGRLDDDAALVAEAEGTLRAFSNEAAVKEQGRMVGDLLLALEEARAEPLHFAVVSAADDDATRALYRAALDVYAPHRLVERVAPGAKYPDLGRPALYLCGAAFCSPPISDPAQVAAKAERFLKPRG